jgi:hypothetical protein
MDRSHQSLLFKRNELSQYLPIFGLKSNIVSFYHHYQGIVKQMSVLASIASSSHSYGGIVVNACNKNKLNRDILTNTITST